MVTQHGLSEVAMVVLSSMNQDAERYRRGLLRAMRLMTFVCACAFGLLAVAGPWLVPWVFGPNWMPATAPLRVMAALAVGGGVVSISGTSLVASGHAKASARLGVGTSFATLVAVFVTARWGLMAVTWAVGIVQCLAMIPALYLLSQNYALRFTQLWAEITPSILVFVLALFGSHVIGTLGSAWYIEPLASLGFCAVMGLGALLLLRRERAERDSVV
jgi:PST family polysaccharide transporter